MSKQGEEYDYKLKPIAWRKIISDWADAFGRIEKEERNENRRIPEV